MPGLAAVPFHPCSLAFLALKIIRLKTIESAPKIEANKANLQAQKRVIVMPDRNSTFFNFPAKMVASSTPTPR